MHRVTKKKEEGRHISPRETKYGRKGFKARKGKVKTEWTMRKLGASEDEKLCREENQ